MTRPGGAGEALAAKSRPVVVAMILSDEREVHRTYERPAPYFGPAPGALLEGLAQTPDVEIHVVSCLQQPVHAPARLADNIYYHAVLVPKWGWLRGGYLGCLHALRKKLGALQPQVVHGQGTERYCALAAAFSRLPNIITIHGHMRRLAALHHSTPFSFDWCTARLESFALPRVGGVVCITAYTQRVVQPLVPRTWIVPNAVDGAFFEVQREAQGENTLLCVGLISRHKNQNALIRALEPLAPRYGFQLVFLGNAKANDVYAREFFDLVRNRPWCRHAGVADRNHIRKAAGAGALVGPPLRGGQLPDGGPGGYGCRRAGGRRARRGRAGFGSARNQRTAVQSRRRGRHPPAGGAYAGGRTLCQRLRSPGQAASSRAFSSARRGASAWDHLPGNGGLRARSYRLVGMEHVLNGVGPKRVNCPRPWIDDRKSASA